MGSGMARGGMRKLGKAHTGSGPRRPEGDRAHKQPRRNRPAAGGLTHGVVVPQMAGTTQPGRRKGPRPCNVPWGRGRGQAHAGSRQRSSHQDPRTPIQAQPGGQGVAEKALPRSLRPDLPIRRPRQRMGAGEEESRRPRCRRRLHRRGRGRRPRRGQRLPR